MCVITLNSGQLEAINSTRRAPWLKMRGDILVVQFTWPLYMKCFMKCHLLLSSVKQLVLTLHELAAVGNASLTAQMQFVLSVRAEPGMYTAFLPLLLPGHQQKQCVYK